VLKIDLKSEPTPNINYAQQGLPTGSTIEYASGKMLTDAIIGRQQLQ